MKEVQEPPTLFFSRIIWQRISKDKLSVFYGIFMLVMALAIPYILNLIAFFLPIVLFICGLSLIAGGLFAYRRN